MTVETAGTPKQPVQKNAAIKSFIIGLVVVVIVVLVGVVLYGKKQITAGATDTLSLAIARLTNAPAASVNGEKISYLQFVEDKGTVMAFYDDQSGGAASYTEEEVEEQVLARLIANELVSQLADEYDVTVTDQDLEDAMQELLAQSPDPATAEQELMDRFGWTVDEYKQNVLFYILQEQQLQQAYEAATPGEGEEASQEVRARHILFQVGPDDDKEAVRAEAEDVLQRIKDGEDFATLAQEYGSDGTAAVGGDLGFFPRGVMVQSFEDAAFSLEPGQLSDTLVETSFGFHIIEVTDKRDVRDFGQFMDAALRSSSIRIYIDAPNPFEEYLAQPVADESAQGDSLDQAEVMEEDGAMMESDQ